MVTLREEYGKHKAKKNKAVTEAAVSWVMENVLLLNETFNRDALMRLQGSISKFDSIFAPFASRVPEVKRSLDDAVELMNRITMGEKITRADGRLRLTDEEKESIAEPATYMVKYMSLLYNNLSRFFNKDMKSLLEFPIFRKAIENPTTPLKDLAEADRMKKAILHALVPGNEIQAILKRMYRSMELPTLDYDKIADELLNLSVQDFKALMGVDKVPLVVSPEKAEAPAMAPPAMEAATSTNPKAPEGTEEDVLTEEEVTALNEAGDAQQLERINQGLQKISVIIKQFPELEATGTALEKLRGQALAAASGKKNFLDPSIKGVAATANIVYNYFEKLAELWPKINQLIPDNRPLNDQEMQQLEAIINKGAGQNLFKRIANFFKSGTTDPALRPEKITADIVNVLRQSATSGDQATMQHLENFFTRLNSLHLPPGLDKSGQPIAPGQNASQGSQQASGTTPAGNAAPTGQTGPSNQAQKSAGAAPPPPNQAPVAQAPAQGGGAPQQAPAPQQGVAGPQPAQIASAMGKTLGINGSNKEFVDQIERLVGAGWKFNPP